MKKIKVIALIAALVVAIGVYQFLKEIGKPQETPRTEVVVAAMDIPENTQITSDMVVMQQVATEALLPGHITDMDSVIGMVMSSDVYAGEQIVYNRLVQVGAAVDQSKTLAYKVDEGMRAVTISVGSASGLSYMLKPGNHVDLIMHYSYEEEEEPEEKAKAAAEDGEEEPEETAEPKTKTVLASRILLQDVQVLAVGSEMSKDGTLEYTTVTLQLTPEEALELSHAEWIGSIGVILRSALDTETLEEFEHTEVTLDVLRGIDNENGEETP